MTVICSSLSTETVLSTPWTSGADDSWGRMQTDCRKIANEFTALSDRAKIHVSMHGGYWEARVHNKPDHTPIHCLSCQAYLRCNAIA